MIRSSRRVGGAVVAAAMLLSPVAGHAAVDYRQSYLDGLEALERGEYRAAVAALQRAVDGRPEEQRRARLVGAIPQPYLPHHYLGIAFHRLRQCRRATEEWSLSAEQGAIGGFPELAASADAGRRECELVARAEAVLAETVPVPSSDHSLDAGLASRRAEARAALTAARRRLGRGLEAWDLEAVGVALAEWTDGNSALAAIEREAAEASRRRETERLAKSQVASTASEVTPLPSEPVPEPAPSEPPAPSAATERVPAEVRAAIEAYFAGDYARAAELLEPLAEPAGRRTATLVTLFRGAARYALFLRGGETDPRLLEQARSDLRACARQAPDFRPDPAHFSPRFRELYRRQLPAAGSN